MMKKISTALGATMFVGLSSLAVPAFATDPSEPQKVYVCKYVGTPDVDERLQTGNNPIEVSVNAIPGYTGQDASALIGMEFADGQGRSIVIAVSAGPGGGQGDEPTIEDCPAPDGPEQPPVEPVVPVVPPVEPVVPPVQPVVPPVQPVVPPVAPVVPPVVAPVAPPVVLGESATNNGGNNNGGNNNGGNNNGGTNNGGTNNAGSNNGGNNNGGADVLGQQAFANNAPAAAAQQSAPAGSAGQVPTVINAGTAGEALANPFGSPAAIALFGALMGLIALGMRRSLARTGGGKA